MLHQDGCSRSWYRDAYLYAIWCRGLEQPSDVEGSVRLYGYSTIPRWMKLVRSGTGLRIVPAEGVAVHAPAAPAAVLALQASVG